jgi:hypothetical protein
MSTPASPESLAVVYIALIWIVLWVCDFVSSPLDIVRSIVAYVRPPDQFERERRDVERLELRVRTAKLQWKLDQLALCAHAAERTRLLSDA